MGRPETPSDYLASVKFTRLLSGLLKEENREWGRKGDDSQPKIGWS